MKETIIIVILCDNNSTIQLSKNPIFYEKNKHIVVVFHFFGDLVKDEVMRLRHCKSKDQVADIKTKPLELQKFEKFRALLQVMKATEIS